MLKHLEKEIGGNKLKIAHIADVHLSELTGPIKDGQNARMMDTVNCMEYATNKLIEEQPDIILISGDLFHKSKLWADEMLKEITIATNWLRELCSLAPTILMFGTANHDNISAFENIKKMDIKDLKVITKPDIITILSNNGLIQIAAIPGMDKGFFRTLYPGMDMTDENKAISEALGNVVLGLSVKLNPEIPSVLMAHYTVTGCQMENGESVFLNSDIVLPTDALAASKFDLVCLGHIHKAQEVPNCGRPTFYSGPLNGITFNEEGQDKGFYIHEIITDLPYDNIKSKFIKTPSREFLTLDMNELDIDYFTRNGMIVIEEGNEVTDKIVRIIYSCSDETNKQFNKKSLEKALFDAGAFYVSEIRPSKIYATTDKRAMSENDSIEDNLSAWLEKQDMVHEDILKVLDIARPMIAEISASLPTGKLSGVFEPLRLEVKNYRSYLQEEFDFTKVSFATVNGPNGIGKSSFFMDAIADCLYEEPREGELTGWISNGDDVKSGAIQFEFLMGADRWRVVRTRAKSGKATLALQKWHEDKWEDHSGDRKDQTQEKILNLLGMDALTFKSCALIMQDNYGLFLEADKTDRMQVLGNILGLSIYDKLYDLAKDELRVQNRKVEALKSQIADLDLKLNEKNKFEENLSNSLEEKNIILCSIKQQEVLLNNMRAKLDELKEIKSNAGILTAKIMAITNELTNKNIEKKKLQSDKERAQKIVDQEDKILAKIAEYEDTNKKISELRIKQPILTQKGADLRELKVNIVNVQGQIDTKEKAINDLKIELQNKDSLESEVSELTTLEEKLTILDKNKTEYEELSQKANNLQQKLSLAQTDYNNKETRILEQIQSCQKKVDLINNSNCLVENPSCNFLKDALEAKNELLELGKDYEKLDHDHIEIIMNDFKKAVDSYKSFQYNPKEHEEIRQQIQVLRKKKEQLLSLSGKDELMKNYLQQRADLIKNLEALQIKSSGLRYDYAVLTQELQPLEELELKLPTLEHWYKGKDELPAAKQLLITSNERLQVLESEIALNNTEKEQLEIDRGKLYESQSNIDVTAMDLVELESKIKNNQNELTNIEVAIRLSQAKIDELAIALNEREKKAEELSESANISKILTLLSKAFSIDGIPFQIVRSVVSELSAQSNEILSQMTGGKMSIEFKMDKVLKNKNEVNALEIWINDYQRGTMPYLSRSGGQKVKAALSVAFALADLKANRAGIQLGMMFIDEPPFLDGEGVQAYCDALELMHNRYSTMRVVAITHDEAMKARFPQNIDVVDAGDHGSKIIFNS